MMSAQAAKEYATGLLHPLPRRLRHVVAVATEAEHLANTIFEDRKEGKVLVAAAWLHDIGYVPELAKTGFHHLDGANALEALGEHRLACLVAHHSSGAKEGHLRVYEDEMAQFPRESTLVADCLTYCDLSQGPDGSHVGLDDRIREVEERYGKEDIVLRGLKLAYPELKRSFDVVEGLLAKP